MFYTVYAVNVFDLLKKRGYIYQASDEEKIRRYLEKPAVLYQGFDPSASSFHVGHLMFFVAFRYLLDSGHKIIFLLGGATGLVGDPTGKTKSRSLMSEEEAVSNLRALENQARRILGKRANIIFLDNAQWLKQASLFDYLRGIAPYLSVNQLLKHETYRTRLMNNLNLSLLELLYSSLQAWDFLYLFDKYNCRLQIGGQDQWRNILDGVGLVRKARGEEVYALTFPLLTVGGKKMGKSEGNAVWLDPLKTTPFEFYQYWLNRPDEELERDLKLFTFLGLNEIRDIMKKHPHKIQKILAFEVTKIVHGSREAKKAAEFQNVPVIKIKEDVLRQGIPLIDLLVEGGVAASKSKARRLINQGGVRIEGKKVLDVNFLLSNELWDGTDKITIRAGKSGFMKVHRI